MLSVLLVSAALAGPHPGVADAVASTSTWRAMRQAEGVPPVPEGAWADVAAGEIVTGLDAVEGYASKKAWGLAVLDAPIDRVWAAVGDETMHVKYTDLEYAELVKGQPCRSGRHVLQYLSVGVPMVKDRWWVTIRTHNDAVAQASGGKVRELVYRNAPDGSDVTSAEGRARLEEGVMVGFTRGSWYMTALDEGHTLVEYYSWVDPGGKLSPSLMNWFAQKGVRNAMAGMETIAHAEGLGCLPQ